MRVTLANKIFVGFACLSLLTILLGLTTFTFIKQTEKSQEKIRLLQEFDLRIQYLNSITETADEHTHDPEMIREQFLRSVDIIEDISRKILSDEPCPYSIETDREDKSCRESTLGTLSSYRQAAVDFFDSLFLAEKIGFKNLLLYRKLSTEVSKIPLSSKRISAIDIIHKLEVYKHAFQESNDPEQINRMKKALKSFQNLKVDKALSGMAEMFVNINEQAYFNTISLKEQGKFLNQTSGQLTEISTRAHDSISQSNLSKQQQIKATALGLGLCSIAMTLLFWLLITKRLSTFLRNQKNAISSIKTGKYNYEINSKYNDELVELNNFIKTLAASLSEEISGREKSQQEKKELQYQLTQAQKLESIGLLAGGVAHDFNNLLTGIGGYSELALAQLEDNHPAKRYVEIISQSGQKAEELTRQLLAFSRKQELNKQIVNANSLVINLTKMMKRMIGEDIALELKTAADLPNIMADPGLIEQILMNLAVNARDAMPQ
ncbi:MAG: histidine kinase dimerization/phospho-acceptor domain-containing protein, partial [Thermodesulfobacteriota bacterium]